MRFCTSPDRTSSRSHAAQTNRPCKNAASEEAAHTPKSDGSLTVDHDSSANDGLAKLHTEWTGVVKGLAVIERNGILCHASILGRLGEDSSRVVADDLKLLRVCLVGERLDQDLTGLLRQGVRGQRLC